MGKPIEVIVSESTIPLARLIEINQGIVQQLNDADEETDLFINIWSLQSVTGIGDFMKQPQALGESIMSHKKRGKVRILANPQHKRIDIPALMLGIRYMHSVKILHDPSQYEALKPSEAAAD